MLLSHSSQKLQSLMKRIGYSFQEPALLSLALTHKSYGHEHNNQRLEFLGDSVLNFLVANWVYQSFPNEDEGILTRRRIDLIRGDYLSLIAHQIELPKLLCYGDRKQNAHILASERVMEDAMEAIIGAVFLDGGIEAAEVLIKRLMTLKKEVQLMEKSDKTKLQEILQANRLDLPIYESTKNGLIFYTCCRIDDLGIYAFASSESKRIAETKTAARATQHLIHYYKLKNPRFFIPKDC